MCTNNRLISMFCDLRSRVATRGMRSRDVRDQRWRRVMARTIVRANVRNVLFVSNRTCVQNAFVIFFEREANVKANYYLLILHPQQRDVEPRPKFRLVVFGGVVRVGRLEALNVYIIHFHLKATIIVFHTGQLIKRNERFLNAFFIF